MKTFSMKVLGLTFALMGFSNVANAQTARPVAGGVRASAGTSGEATTGWWPTSTDDGDVVDLNAAVRNSSIDQIDSWVKSITLVLKEPQIVPPGTDRIQVGRCTIILNTTNPTSYIDFKRGREIKFNGADSTATANNSWVRLSPGNDPTISSVLCTKSGSGSIAQYLEGLKPIFDYKIDVGSVSRVVGSKPKAPKEDALAYDFEQGNANTGH